jgi:nucleotide-binding universal stress UspA family protein
MRSDGTFSTIVCAVDGSPDGLEAVRQAAALAGADASLELVAVVAEEFETDPRAGITSRDAKPALAEASEVAAAAGTYFVARTVDGEGRYVWDRLLDSAARADLLVLGRRHRRLPRPMAGQTVTNVLARTKIPVLIAVPPPDGFSFPGRILVGADGAGTVASAIAQRSGGDVVLERVESHEIVKYARLERASLVVTTSSSKPGVRRLVGAAEPIAGVAPCSVLVLPDHSSFVTSPDTRGTENAPTKTAT